MNPAREMSGRLIYSRGTLIFLLLLVLAFLPRLWNALSVGDDFYANFLSDASTYRLWAAKLASGLTYGDPVFSMGPLYPYFLAALLRIGFDFSSVLLLQAVLGSFTVVFIYLCARDVFGEGAGLISGILAAGFAPFIFYDGLLLSESLQLLLIAVSLHLLITKNGSHGLLRVFLAGTLSGLTALGRGTVVVFPLLVALFWLVRYFVSGKRDGGSHPVRAVILLMGLLLGISPATVHNLSNGDAVLISSNVGINFFIGNNIHATGSYEEPPGLDLSTDFTGRKIAERFAGRKLKASEVSSFWMTQAVEDIMDFPAHFAWGLVRKLWLYFWYFDIPQMESLHIHHMFSSLFRFPLFGFWLVLTLGLVGMAFARLDERSWIPIMLFISNVLGTILFFVIGRFRLHGSLALLVTSGAGVSVIAGCLRRREWLRISSPLALALMITILTLMPRPMDRKVKTASALDNVGIFHYYRGENREAMYWFRRAGAASPSYPPSFNNIGAYFYSIGELDSARIYFHKALSVDSTEHTSLMNLGRIHLEQNEADSARKYLEKARRFAPFSTAAEDLLRNLKHMSAGLEETEPEYSSSFNALLAKAEQLSSRRRFAEAQQYYLQALELSPDNIKALNNLGFAYQAEKKYEKAAEQFMKVLELSPHHAVALNNLAGTVYQMGLVDSARALWEKALVLDPANAQIRKNLEVVKQR